MTGASRHFHTLPRALRGHAGQGLGRFSHWAPTPFTLPPRHQHRVPVGLRLSGESCSALPSGSPVTEILMVLGDWN